MSENSIPGQHAGLVTRAKTSRRNPLIPLGAALVAVRVVTLGGHVPSDNDRSRAESIAKDIANGQVVSNEIGVIPPAIEDEAKKVNSDHDKAIAKNLDAALVQNRLKEDVRYDVKNAVVPYALPLADPPSGLSPDRTGAPVLLLELFGTR